MGDERISVELPKKRGWLFIYFIQINNAKNMQNIDRIGIYMISVPKIHNRYLSIKREGKRESGRNGRES